MKSIQNTEFRIVIERVSLKDKLVSFFRRHKHASFKAKLHRYRATPDALAA
ncbi:MAG: hypothetical protein O3B73_03195 [bacterium]|jgi:hypothetical protein|nr:hypothetical protein [bacterium]